MPKEQIQKVVPGQEKKLDESNDASVPEEDPCAIAASVFPAAILDECDFGRNYIKIILRDLMPDGDYFGTEEALRKTFAIDGFKLMYLNPKRDYVFIQVNTTGKTWHMKLYKHDAVDWFGIEPDSLREYSPQGKLYTGNKWSNLFLGKYNNPEKRKAFFEKFVKEGPLPDKK